MNDEFLELGDKAYSGIQSITPDKHAELIALLRVTVKKLEDRIVGCEVINNILADELIKLGVIPDLQDSFDMVASGIRENARPKSPENSARAKIVAYYVEKAASRYTEKEGRIPKFGVISGGIEGE